MAFTAGELANIANAALDFYIKGDAMSQTIQDKPLYSAMKSAQKKFPGGKGNIDLPVKGVYTTSLSGYTHDDTVTYQNPANIKRVAYPWKELHAGISLTLTELKHDGISVVDSARSEGVSNHSGREKTALTGLLADKLEDMAEGWARSFNSMLWADGTQDAKEVPGILSIITDKPDAVGTVGGLDQVANTWWRNRQATTDGVTDSRVDVTGGTELIEFIHTEIRQLRRYGGKPTIALCGSDFLDQLVKELRAKGNYTETGFKGSSDISIGEISYQNIKFQYDPTMDDIAGTANQDFAKRAYFIDPKHLYLDVMEGEDMKTHTPSRPADQYVMYRAMTWTGGLVASMRNCHGVYEFK